MYIKLIVALLIVTASSYREAYGQNFPILRTFKSTGKDFQVEQLLKDQGVIWGFSFIGKQHLLFTEREGQLKILDIKNKKTSPIQGVPQVLNAGQGGLLDVILHPEFAKNNQLYLSYAISIGKRNATRVTLYSLANNQLKQIKHIVTSHPASDKTIHFGSRLAIDQNNYLYVSIGDRGYRENAQKLDSLNGKILRFHLDGRTPNDNPFIKQKGALPEIWSYGHRNPQGLTVHPQSNELWSHEHGPRGGDEVNLIKKGQNYGWPVITYGKEYWGPSIGEGTKKQGMQQPIYYYVPSIAPSGMSFYTGKVIKEWQGNLFLGALKLTHINRLEFKGQKVVKEERLIDDWEHRIRAIKQGPDGFLYASTDDGQLIRIRPK